MTGNQAGDFVVRLDALVGAATLLPLGQITRAEFDAGSPPLRYRITQDPDAETLLTVSAIDPTFRFSLDLIDATGQRVASFNPETLSMVLSIPAGGGAYDLLLTAADASAAGMLLIDLESGAPAAPTATPLPQSAAAYCQISANGSANIRSAPDPAAPILDHLNRSRAVDVVGVSADGAWYAVQLATRIGWVAQSVARQITPCPPLPPVNP